MEKPKGNIVVIGSGTMGLGIAHVACAAGYRVYLQDVSKEMLLQAKKKIQENMEKGVERGKLTKEDMRRALAMLSYGERFEPEMENIDLVIEAVSERLDLKCKIFASLHEKVGKKTIFASNTSGLSITEMGSASGRPDRFLGMHFFNPVHKMKLVEVIKGKNTAEASLNLAMKIAKDMGKVTVLLNESPGFVTSRMNALIGNEAFRMLEAGIASAEDIDKALKYGLNHPMGPFELVDLVGLDIRLSVLQNLHEELGELYRPSKLLETYVQQGRLGKKSGRGVYDYRGMSSGKAGPGFAK